MILRLRLLVSGERYELAHRYCQRGDDCCPRTFGVHDGEQREIQQVRDVDSRLRAPPDLGQKDHQVSEDLPVGQRFNPAPSGVVGMPSDVRRAADAYRSGGVPDGLREAQQRTET